jgi:DNA adenine methylase
MNVRAPHPIPYQGSKRSIARYILSCFPNDVDTLIEPFAGSAAVTLAAALHNKAERFLVNDVNKPLIALWDQIVNHPAAIANAYRRLWEAQQDREREFFDQVRSRFNQTQRSDYLLYLLARCVKSAVRYNSNGEFNQSPDNRRKGMLPATMLSHIVGASNLLKTRTELTCTDYRDVAGKASTTDLVYLDPPYQGVSGDKDRRYAQSLSYDNFVASLEELKHNNVSFIVSYDGSTGAKKFGKPLPGSLNLTLMEINAGKSSQATLLGRDEDTVESLYLSPALVARISNRSVNLNFQPTLFTFGAARNLSSTSSATPGRRKRQTTEVQ